MPPVRNDSTDTAITGERWPESCCYFDRRLMSINSIRHWLDEGFRFNEPGNVVDGWLLRYNNSGKTELSLYDNALHMLEKTNRGLSDEPDMTIMSIKRDREWSSEANSFVEKLALDSKAQWQQVLEHLDVWPSVFEMLFGSDLEVGRHISYDRRTAVDGQTELTPEALHICIKFAPSTESELLIYTRQHFTNGKSVVLLLGAYPVVVADAVQDSIRGCQDVTPFHVMRMVLSRFVGTILSHTRDAEKRVKDLEARTGYTLWDVDSPFEPLPACELHSDTALQTTAEYARLWALTCTQTVDIINFLLQQLRDYKDIKRPALASGLRADFAGLSDNFRHRRVSVQSHKRRFEELLRRVEVQIDVVKSLVTERDSRVTIEIGRAANRDSRIMRSIGWVTMIFLPATFAATFFSMVFFHGGDETAIHLQVERNIWLYPALTVPLTLFMLAMYLKGLQATGSRESLLARTKTQQQSSRNHEKV